MHRPSLPDLAVQRRINPCFLTGKRAQPMVGPRERNEPVLIPMYAKTSRRSPPSRPFVTLLCPLRVLPCTASVPVILDRLNRCGVFFSTCLRQGQAPRHARQQACPRSLEGRTRQCAAVGRPGDGEFRIPAREPSMPASLTSCAWLELRRGCGSVSARRGFSGPWRRRARSSYSPPQ